MGLMVLFLRLIFLRAGKVQPPHVVLSLRLKMPNRPQPWIECGYARPFFTWQSGSAPGCCEMLPKLAAAAQPRVVARDAVGGL
jgi:hypothetical protein